MSPRVPCVLTVLVLAGLSLSGCLDAKDACTSDCDEEVPTTDTAPAAFDKIVFEECVGFWTLRVVPEDWVQPFVPDAFTIGGLAPGSGSIGIRGFSCGRIVSNTTAFEDVAFLFTGAAVTPGDRDWQEHSSSYILDFFVSDPLLGEEFAKFGIDVRVGDVQATPSAVPGGINLQRFRAEDSEGMIEVVFQSTSQGPGADSGQSHMWTGTGPFHRIDKQEQNRYDSVAASVLSVVSTGNTLYGKINQDTVVAQHAGNILSDHEMEWNLTSTSFQ